MYTWRRSWHSVLWLVVGVFLPLGLAGCDSIFGSDEAEPARTPGGINAECANDNQCRTGLSCLQRNCAPAGTTAVGASCTLTAECAEGLFCKSELTIQGEVGGNCRAGGAGQVDDNCSTDGDCEKGLRCELFGFSGTCSATGESDLGAECVAASECMAGLTCTTEGLCGQSLFPTGVVVFTGGECPIDTLEGGFKVYFDVPRTGSTVTDFYSLPFPNDIRREGDRLDLSGHPRPALDVVGNLVKTLTELVEVEAGGFGPHQAVLFRMNAFPQGDSLRIDGETPSLFLVNIDDPEAEDYGARLSIAFSAASGRGRFICNNWLAMRPFWNEPFAAGRTYAAVVTTSIRGPNGDAPVQSPDLVAVLGGARPSDADLGAAWDAYAPLRTYLANEGMAVANIAAAAVFTIGNPARRMPALRAAVEAEGAPDVGDLVLCDTGVTSPCEDGLEGDEHVRGCFAATDDFYEIHTRVPVPIYQEGEAPYLTEGGTISFQDNGAPILQRTEDVCAAITIPRDATMPEGGWPVAVYGHGTGGSFRTHVGSYASDLSAIGYATIGFDGVQHGERRGDSNRDPDALFFNYVNPRGVKGTILQGAVDVMVMGRYAANVDVTAGASPTDEAILFNPAQVVFFGHSQGSIVGVPALAVDDAYAAAILSGGGGGLLLSLLEKSSPVDIASGVQALLGESSLSDTHPFLNLMQLYFEPVESLNYGPAVVRNRPEGMAPIHLFVTWGQGDTFTPNRTTQELVHSLGIPVLTPVIVPFGRPEVNPPVTGNLFVDTFEVTTALGQYAPAAGNDGHFVAFDVAAARTQLLGFLETFASNGEPTIPVP